MFHHLRRVKETTHKHKGVTYEIRIFKSNEDGHLPRVRLYRRTFGPSNP
jgi:hypothetical protein